ncbi:vesicle-trafficking protein SEC22b-like [Argonauta hians]
MILMTMIARVADGLPLAASVQEDEQSGRNLMEYQNQAKQLFKKICGNASPTTRQTIETGQYFFHYLIELGVCYLVLCERVFSKKLAFLYLEELQGEFSVLYGKKVDTVSRPYHFIEFDTFIQKTRKCYMDSRARKNLSSINTELQDVQRIMVQNIDDVLQRGEALNTLGNKASNLSILSQQYKKDATYLNLRSTYAKAAAVVIVIVVLMLFIRFLWW